MFRFQHTDHLYLLILLPIFIFLFLGMLIWRKNRLKKIGQQALVNTQMEGIIPGRLSFKFILLSIALGAAIIGWANLQKGSGTEEVQRKGVDVMIALDVSKSMLAQDIQPNRLARAKQLILSMLDKMKNDRVGLVIFAGRAYLQVPLTIDYSAIRMMLQNVGPELVPTQGTVIGDAIELAMKSFSQKERKYKSLVIISDGEDHDEKAIQNAKDAFDNGIIIHTVGVGSPEGTTLFDPETKAVKLDEQGNPIVSKLNEDELRGIAATGKGNYLLLRNADDVAGKLVNEIDGMEQKNLGSLMFSNYTSYFQYFLALSFVALTIEWMIFGKKLKPKTT
ncbi:MAG: VWA domain-containing protein [Bacteroidetes bacterium]|nr:VWA domain-containing protein [Bacteroidota bacterium]MBS1739142.1 VWA domain-containing protein [Bacteroidota bacterium]MBS1775848.1 VWA domain-containing protein [Bacteroidota bacterium]